jgi:ABC-2 type transport system permease protein
MELLLAQPIRRTQIIVAHLAVDIMAFPALCVVMWLGTYCGTSWMGLQSLAQGKIEPLRFLPALLFVFALLFSVSGLTMGMSALGRSRARVWGWAITLILSMFLINVLGQMWPEWLDDLRPFTLFYHYKPQAMVLSEDWYSLSETWFHLAVLLLVGSGGYLLAWFAFTRRDLPAPL